MDIIFDFGKVLVRFDPLYMTRAYIPDAERAKKASEILFDRAYWDKLDRGELRDSDVCALACARLDERDREAGAMAVMNWYRHLPDMPGMRELVRDLARRGDRLFVLSNISIDFAEKWREAENVRTLFSYFTGLVFSGPRGILKPSREAFEIFETEYGADLPECLFVDDSPANIDGARRLGIKTFLFNENAEELRRFILG